MNRSEDDTQYPETLGERIGFWSYLVYLVILLFLTANVTDTVLEKWFDVNPIQSWYISAPTAGISWFVLAWISAWVVTWILNTARWIWGDPL